ncbi:hypothetical protein L7F22_005997 [Adiantum nelumboides]|nr:hypothetical protein [Adiantum nelumboides]
MDAMFTVKDLEVYKDSLKEKKNNTGKTADKPLLHTPPSLTKLSKPPLKPNNNEKPLKERKPLSVVLKTSNTIKDPHKPSSPIPIGSSKQANQLRKSKETTLTCLSAGKTHISDANTLVKASVYKPDSLKSPKEPLPLKPAHIKSDDSKALVGPKQATYASPVYQKSSSLSGAKAASTVDLNASLCSECIRSASEGAVCFIGNDGRVSACTTRSAVRLCKNLNCAANNPEYVAAMANAPKKYLISKRHSLKAQFGPKSKSVRPKSPNVHQSNAVDAEGSSPEAVSPSVEELSPSNAYGIASSFSIESDDMNSSLLGDDFGSLDDGMSLLDGDASIENDDIGSTSADATAVLNDAIDEHTDFSFHDGEVTEPESPKFLVVESPKDLDVAQSAGAIESFNEDAESLAIESFEEADDEDLDGSPMHRESKAEELSIIYCDLMPSEEADVEDVSSNAAELTQLSAGMTETVDVLLRTGEGENGWKEGNQTSVRLLTSDCDQDGGSNQESSLAPTAIVNELVVHNSRIDESIPILERKQLVEDSSGGYLDAAKRVDDLKTSNLATLNGMDMEHDNLKGSDHVSCAESFGYSVSFSVADKQRDDEPPLQEAEDVLSGAMSLPVQKQVDCKESGIMSVLCAEIEQNNGGMSYINDDTREEYEDESEDEDSEDIESDEKLSGISAREENVGIDALERKDDKLTKLVVKDQDGGTMSSPSTRRQRRRRILRGVEEVSPETVTLRKQQMLERKQAEEWMLNHAIEGVVHKLAPTGEAKVKILVEAFESIISHTEVEIVETHNTRQEKRVSA